MNKQPAALHVSQLTVNYDQIPVLWDISLEIPPGELVGIVGPNGAGKSTFLKTVLGILTPLSGKVSFFDQPLATVRKRVAYVPQRETVDWDFPITVRDLVLMGRYGRLGVFRWPRAADRAAAEFYLDRVGMLPYADRQISQLSGGQQQRIFFARALLQEADIYFLDEPFAGVDMSTEKILLQLLEDLRQEGKTIFIVHHDLNSVESIFSWVMLLNIRLIAVGPTDQVFSSEMLYATYGKSYTLLDQALRLSNKKTAGLEG